MSIIQEIYEEFNPQRRLWMILNDEGGPPAFIGVDHIATINDLRKFYPEVTRNLTRLCQKVTGEPNYQRLINTIINGAKLAIVGAVTPPQVAGYTISRYKDQLGCSCDAYTAGIYNITYNQKKRPLGAPALQNGNVICKHIAAYLITTTGDYTE